MTRRPLPPSLNVTGNRASREGLLEVVTTSLMKTMTVMLGGHPLGGWRPAYFLLSSLARQVAASTALMVAARRPPCSRA